LDLRLPPGGKEQIEKLLKNINQAEKSQARNRFIKTVK